MSPYYSKDILSILVKIINSSGILSCEKTELLACKKLLKEKATILQFGNQYNTRNTCQLRKLIGYSWMSRMPSQWLVLSTYWNCEMPKALVKRTCKFVRVFSDRITRGRKACHCEDGGLWGAEALRWMKMKKENVSWILAFSFLFPGPGRWWQVFSCAVDRSWSCDHAFPTLMGCIAQNMNPSNPFLLKLFIVRIRSR